MATTITVTPSALPVIEYKTLEDNPVGPIGFVPSDYSAYGLDGDGDGQIDVINGYDLVINAFGYAFGESCVIYIGGNYLGTLPADGAGQVKGTLRYVGELSAGTVTISCTGSSSKRSAQTDVVVA